MKNFMRIFFRRQSVFLGPIAPHYMLLGETKRSDATHKHPIPRRIYQRIDDLFVSSVFAPRTTLIA